MTTPDTIITIPGDDPPQLQGSLHFERLRAYGEVRLFTDRPETVEEKVHRARDAICLINSRGSLHRLSSSKDTPTWFRAWRTPRMAVAWPRQAATPPFACGIRQMAGSCYIASRPKKEVKDDA
jgi:hypothetical protein